MKSLHRFLFPLLALAAIALSLSGVALAREISEMEFFNSSAGEVEITGVVESYDGSTLVINGQTIVVPVTAEIKGEIVVGQVVKVHAMPGANDTLTAREIEPAVPGVIGDDVDDDSSNINGDDDLVDDPDDDSANINADDDLDDDFGDDNANINANDDIDDDLSDDNSANINADDDLDDDNSANYNADHDSDDDDNSNSNTNSGQDDDDNSDDDDNNTNTNSGHDDNHNDDNDNSGSNSGNDNGQSGDD